MKFINHTKHYRKIFVTFYQNVGIHIENVNIQVLGDEGKERNVTAFSLARKTSKISQQCHLRILPQNFTHVFNILLNEINKYIN